MKLSIELTEAERRTLQQLSRNHPYRDFRHRGLGLLLLQEGWTAVDISIELEVSFKSVYNWAYTWQDKGLSGLLSGHKGGRPRAMSDSLVATATEAAKSNSMTLKQIAEHIEAVHGEVLPCCLETLSLELRRAGFSYKRGRYCLKKTVARRNSRQKPTCWTN